MLGGAAGNDGWCRHLREQSDGLSRKLAHSIPTLKLPSDYLSQRAKMLILIHRRCLSTSGDNVFRCDCLADDAV